MTLTPQQKKMLWICLGILGVSYVGRSVIDYSRQAAFYQRQAIRAAQQREWARTHPPAPKPVPAPGATAPGTPATSAVAKPVPDAFSGTWRGKAAIVGRGICVVNVEMHQTEPTKFSGFFTLSCGNFGPLMAKQDRNRAAATLNQMSPAESIVTGTMENGAIHFTVDKTLNTNSNGCAATSLILTPYGGKSLAGQWTEEGCQGGHVLLWRAKS
jgi:hypothetical protein